MGDEDKGEKGVLQKLSDVENMGLGIAAGVIEICIDQPCVCRAFCFARLLLRALATLAL